jgi:hypothetical protein
MPSTGIPSGRTLQGDAASTVEAEDAQQALVIAVGASSGHGGGTQRTGIGEAGSTWPIRVPQLPVHAGVIAAIGI